MPNLPIFYSFRRCPYAMRARMALLSSNQHCELREVVLRDKPAQMLIASPKATVPVLIDQTRDGAVIDESLDVMLWALNQNDPAALLTPQIGDRTQMLALIEEMDGPFKSHLDKYKYSSRHEGSLEEVRAAGLAHRDAAAKLLENLEGRLQHTPFLFGDRRSLADLAIAPFVRQFANTDRDWFEKLSLPKVQQWLADFINSELFLACMNKYAKWEANAPVIVFPGPASC